MRQAQQQTTSVTRRDDFISEQSGTGVLFVAFELNWSEWKLAFGTAKGQKPRRRSVEARDLAGLQMELEKAKQRFKLPADAAVCACYEAGRDGFWLHRYLTARGIDNVVVDSASIEVNRRARRAKNDALDSGKLLSMLIRYHSGESGIWAVVRTPSADDEDLRQRQRELQTLRQERTEHTSRIKGLLAAQGLDVSVDKGLRGRLECLRLWDGRPLPPHLLSRVQRELDRIDLLDRQLREIEHQRREHQRCGQGGQAHQVRQLCTLRGIGPESAWLTVGELFSWRQIRNRKQLAALAGLTPTPYDSGSVHRDQGISKAGNKRVRGMLIQIAWGWLRHQPNSALSRWYERRFGSGSKRQRRIGIVALARKLLVALWRYLQTGVVPEGAALSTT